MYNFNESLEDIKYVSNNHNMMLQVASVNPQDRSLLCMQPQ